MSKENFAHNVINRIEISLIPLDLCSGRNVDAIHDQQAQAHRICSNPRHRTPKKAIEKQSGSRHQFAPN